MRAGKSLALILASLSLSTPVRAERTLTGVEIKRALAEHVFVGTHNNQPTEQIYRSSGDTFYSENGVQSQGRWEVRGDEYCSVWPPSSYWTCFSVSESEGTIIFISKTGVRSHSRLLK